MDTKLPLVVVEWDDACTFDSGATMKDVLASHRPERVTTIGWLMVDDEVGVMIACEFYDDTYRGRSFILRSMVRSVTPFTLTKPRKKKPQIEATEGAQ